MKEKNSEKVIVFKDAVKEYSLGERKLRVLNGVTFSVNEGEFLVVMGPSGSGKSTLLHLMGCLDQPTSGEIYVGGEEISLMDSNSLAEVRSKKIGFVFQAFNLLPNLSALQNVEIALSINEVPKEERLKRARKLLSQVGLSERETHKPSELSGGEKQRVAIARALANRPSILLADEPTGNLDSKSGAEVMEMIYKLWKNDGMTVIIATHEPVVAQYSKRIIRLRDGLIESQETTRDVNKRMWFKTK